MAGKTCVICGKPSGMYPLCIPHLEAKKDGKVVKCEICKTWHETDKLCKCKTPTIMVEKKEKPKEAPQENPFSKRTFDKVPPKQEIEEIPFIKKSFDTQLMCFLCQEKPADKGHYCSSCYNKYRGQSIVVTIEHCKDVSIDEKYVEGIIHTAPDGHKVRSKDELLIDTYLFREKILHSYEATLRVEKEKYGVDKIHPDFYLKELDIYIEHLGYKNTPTYKKANLLKKKIFEDYRKTVIYTYSSDISDIDSNLAYYITEATKPENKGKLMYWHDPSQED